MEIPWVLLFSVFYTKLIKVKGLDKIVINLVYFSLPGRPDDDVPVLVRADTTEGLLALDDENGLTGVTSDNSLAEESCNVPATR